MELRVGPCALAEFSGDKFQLLVGQTLRFLRPSASGVEREPIDLNVIDVRMSRFSGLPGKRQPFSVLLTLRDAAPLADRFLHMLVHPEFEQCELLLSRVSVPELERHDGTMYYEMIFG